MSARDFDDEATPDVLDGLVAVLASAHPANTRRKLADMAIFLSN